MKALWFMSLGCLAMAACYCDNETIPLKLPSKAKNLYAMNSPYDDWNCADPTVYFEPGMYFMFSSNRQSQGNHFDIQSQILVMEHDTAYESQPHHERWIQLVQTINTEQDELGPTVLRESEEEFQSYGEFASIRALAFARGDSGFHNIFVQYVDTDSSVSFWEYDSQYNPVPHKELVIPSLDLLNSDSDEGYPTYHESSHSLLFHSNRNGTYRIYQATLPQGVGLYQWLRQPTPVDIRLLTELQGNDGEERTPFLRSNILYFVSNRSDGLGGFDIWQSTWNNGQWSSPINMGDQINSSDNEYRPMVLRVSGASNFPKVMFWSSDRLGGLGGYDLYYSGIR